MFNVLDMADDIKRAARSVAVQWPGTISADEVEQEMYVKLLESPGSVESLLSEMDDRQRYGALNRIGHRVAAEYRADYEVFSGNFRYSVGEVRELLKGGILTKERNDLSPERLDADEALELISDRRREIIWSEYVIGDYDKTEGAARKELTRAVDSLADHMNQVYRNRQSEYTSGPGSRKAIPNGHAQAKTSNQYSD